MKIFTFPVGEMQANCYFLTCDSETSADCAIVDPGAQADRLLDKLSDKGLTLRWILLTHVHFDHIMALEEIREKTGAPVAVHELDAPALLDPKHSLMWQYARISTPCRPADRLLHDGEKIMLGGEEITVWHTPGHTMGSVCYETDGKLLTGDTLFRDSIGRHDFYGGDYGQLMQSLHRLRDMEGDRRIYPGHGPSSSLSREREYNPYLR